MQSFLPSKAMAKLLRQALAERKIDLSHSDCLELVARQCGLPNWNVLAAQLAPAQAKGKPLDMPDGWFATGFTDVANYRLGLDPSSPGTAIIENRRDRHEAPDKNEFACLMQSIDAADYIGGKIRLTASLRTEDAELATIWLRIDKAPGAVLRFDNMMQRRSDGPIGASTGWTARNIVLEVPAEATSIHYGFFLKGRGRVWARAFQLEAVGAELGTTDMPRKPDERRYLPRPANLDFSERHRPEAP